MRAEALFRRFQRTVEAIDKKANFPAPKVRQRPIQNASLGSTQSLPRPASSGASPNSGSVGSTSATDAGTSPQGATSVSPVAAKGKGRASTEEEVTLPQTKVISPELRGLLSRKVEILPRRIVRKEGDGLGKVGKK